MTEETEEVPLITRRELWTALAGLILCLALASLDQNIVAVALPRIVSELGGLSQLSWVVTSFLVTSTAMTPLYGKLSDMYGRKPLFIIAIVTFIIGSCLCGLSRSMFELLVFRGIQGLGAGGLMVLSMTTIADLVPPRERGRYQGLFSAVFVFSSVAGPLIGGFITTALSWRWIFYVNMPVGLVALSLIVFGYQRPPHKVSHSIDYGGAALLALATVALLLLLSWGGVQYPWSSPLILGLAIIAVVICLLLVMQERRTEEPLLSPHVFHNKVFAIATIVMSLSFMGLFAASVFLPLFFQLVLGMPPADAGLMMAPMSGGAIVASFVGGHLVARTGRYKKFPIMGLAAATLAFICIMWAALTDAGVLSFEVALIFLGLGFGLTMPNLVVAVQNSVSRHEVGIATAMATFFRQLGGMFGVTISATIMTAQLQMPHMEKWASLGKGGRNLVERGIQEISQLPLAQKTLVLQTYREAISTTFLAGAVITTLAFVLAFLLPEYPLQSAKKGETEPL